MARVFYISLTIVLIGLIREIDGYKILAFFPFPAKSHQRVWDPLLKELALRGHHVTALKSFPMDDPPSENYQEALVPDVLEEVIKMFGAGDSFKRMTFFEKIMMSLFFKEAGLVTGELWMKEQSVQNILSMNATFDAVLFESGFMQEYFTTLQHKFNAVGIEVSTTGNFHWIYWLFGNPVDTSYVVDAGTCDYTDRLSFLQRLHLTVQSSLVRFVWYSGYMWKYQQFMDKHLRYPGWETRPPMTEMISKTSLVLVNTDVALTYPHPMSPHFIEIGGINIMPNKPLPKDLKDFINGATEGVIFFTLGSHIKVSTIMGNSLRDVFVNVFSNLKQRVLWKWEDDSFTDVPPNVKISKWFPQQDILAHKNMKLFITHGGLLSLTESIHYGVPMIGIPIMADQDKNVKFIEYHGLGIQLTLDNITEDSVSWAIKEIVDSPRYKENALRQSRILKDKPMKPLDKAVYWTEYAIRHKGAHHLKPAIASMPWYQQAMIDVYSAIALFIFLVFYFAYLMIKIFYHCVSYIICNSKKDKEKIG